MSKTKKNATEESNIANAQTNELAPRKPLRLWPGVVIVALSLLARFVVPEVFPEAIIGGMMIGIFGGALATLIWWLFFSRAAWFDRLAAVGLMIVGLFGTRYILQRGSARGALVPDSQAAVREQADHVAAQQAGLSAGAGPADRGGTGAARDASAERLRGDVGRRRQARRVGPRQSRHPRSLSKSNTRQAGQAMATATLCLPWLVRRTPCGLAARAAWCAGT